METKQKEGIVMENLMTYDYEKILECIEEVKKLPTTTKKKEEHSFLVIETKRVLDFCFQKTKCFSFYEEDAHYKDYINAFYKNERKNILDKQLKRFVEYMRFEIIELKHMCDMGEVNVVNKIFLVGGK